MKGEDWWESYYSSNASESSVLIVFWCILNALAFINVVFTFNKCLKLKRVQKPIKIVNQQQLPLQRVYAQPLQPFPIVEAPHMESGPEGMEVIPKT
mmetsp:Transcript_33405/g.51257  ORF Transcript_33405/g.51257 Transcript_33405/m.51257 type:complete len:96 (-) Transcript_33405:9-296(-)